MKKSKSRGISKGLKIGMLIGSSILTIGGATMIGVCGATTYTGYGINPSGSTKMVRKNFGIGWFNFDNTTLDSKFVSIIGEPTLTYEEAKREVNTLSDSEKKFTIKQYELALEFVLNNTTLDPATKELAINIALDNLNFFKAWFAMPLMFDLTIFGIALAPVGLILTMVFAFVRSKRKKVTEDWGYEVNDY